MNRSDKLAFLRELPIFRYASDEILLELAEISTEKTFLAHERIITKGEFGTDMYIIVKGKVKVHNQATHIAILRPKEVFGELAALAPEVRIASVTALEDTLLLNIEHDHLYVIMEKSIDFVKGLIEVLCQRTRALACMRMKSSS